MVQDSSESGHRGHAPDVLSQRSGGRGFPSSRPSPFAFLDHFHVEQFLNDIGYRLQAQRHKSADFRARAVWLFPNKLKDSGKIAIGFLESVER
nr:hypothetical protein [Agrobacterium pusense]